METIRKTPKPGLSFWSGERRSIFVSEAAKFSRADAIILQFLIELSYGWASAKKGVFPMNENKRTIISERRRDAHWSVLEAFNEIAQNCLKMARGGQELGNPMESYLDGGVVIRGASYRRRSVLLAVHDLKDERQAPLALQRKTLARLTCLQMLPVPKLGRYSDVATAILRIEAFIRLSIAEGADVGMRQPLNLVPVMPQREEVRQLFHCAAAAASLRLAEFHAALAALHAPRLPALTLTGLRYQWASSLRTIIST